MVKATNIDSSTLVASRHETVGPESSVYKTRPLVWAPALGSEPEELLLEWAREVESAGLGTERKVLLILNGHGAESLCSSLLRRISRSVEVCSLPGPASIGRVQQFVMHRFLQSDAQVLARIDPDGQFPIRHLQELATHLTPDGPDILVGQRDEAGVAGRTRFLGNVVQRLLALRFRIVADPNSGFYLLNRKAAAVLCQVPLPRYPESRMLVALTIASLAISSKVVPTLLRRGGRSSFAGLWRGVIVFVSSFMEFFSWDSP